MKRSVRPSSSSVKSDVGKSLATPVVPNNVSVPEKDTSFTPPDDHINEVSVCYL